MHLKREFNWKASAFRVFKSLRKYALPVVCGLFLSAVTVNTASAEPTTVQQRTVKISGKILDPSGEPLIGASVVERGTANGTATDADGAYTLSVVPGATIEVKYIGYLSQSVKTVSGTSVYNITMKEDSKSLEEVVVIGYGVQKKKLVTGATIQVKGEDLQKRSTTNVFTALQSQAPGVSIMQNNGQPGAGYIVNIRGISTNGESRPLYVVDGVAAGNDALNNMSAADIESIDILKDAASAAIYGARAANGVVLVTTKQGKAGKVSISYDGYYGQQYMTKKPDLLNAREYIQVQEERCFNTGVPAYNWNALLPKGMYDDIMSGKWNGSDWVEAFYNKGAIDQGHAINLTGGNEISKFSMGYSYAKKDGIFGEAAQSNYTRNTFRINSDHVLLKVKDFEALKIGETMTFNYRTDHGIATGNMYWNDFTQVLRANPLLPIYNENGGYYDQNDKNANGWIFEGAAANPIAVAATSGRGLNLHKNYGLRASAYLQIQPVKNLIFKSTFGYNMSAYTGRSMDKAVYLGTNTNRPYDTVNQDANAGYGWNLDNVLTYILSTGGNNITAQVGQSVEKWGYGESVSAGRNYNNFTGLGWDYAWVNNFIPTDFKDTWNGGSPWGQGALASFWGRVLYNYKETYIASVSLRSDGSSVFARGKRWGYFPAISAGWIVSNESFMESLKGTLDYLKLTASWGQNGNMAGIEGFQYITSYEFPNTALYYFGDGAKSTQSKGATPKRLKNPNLTWENQQILDLGLDSRWLNSRLGLQFNYFVKDRKNWLLETPIPGTWGIPGPTQNGGAVQNKGVELSLTWNDHVNNDFNYGINLNWSYITSIVTQIANTEKVIHGSSDLLAQGTSELTRLWVGHPMSMFYGWKADGIFQNQAEVDAYTFTYVDKDTGKSVTKPIIPGAKPGDVRFRDVNGDGKIDEQDKTEIGCGMPTTNLGLSLNFGYKGFDLGIDAHGSFGFQIAKSYRSFSDSEMQNYTTTVFKRWTGEGTSNKWPRLTNGNNINYQYVSDIFLEQGDYVKIQNITFGYDFKRLFPHMPLGKARIYVMGQNLFTFTGYTGMDPEIGFGDGKSWVRGVDVGYYPNAKTFMAGVQLTF